MALFDYIEVFYNQRRHSMIGQISPAEFERRAIAEGMDAMEDRPEHSFPQRPHPLSFSWKEESDQAHPEGLTPDSLAPDA